MKKKFIVGMVILIVLLITTSVVYAYYNNSYGDGLFSAKPWMKAKCTTIQSRELLRSDNVPIVLGYDEWGYNYQAHIFNGGYCDAYRDAAWCQPYKDTNLIMKWNDAWMSDMDCDGDNKLDRHYGFDSYIGSGAWETNHQSGSYEQEGVTCYWDYFVKIAAAPANAYTTPDSTNCPSFLGLDEKKWYTEDNVEIGCSIWNEFAVIQEVQNDPCAGSEGIIYNSPLGPGFGHI